METNALQRMEPENGGGELIVHQPLPPPSLFGTADPVEVVARASRVAASLKEVIKAQGLISKISGKEYPRCEAWTLLGTMLGVFPVLVWTRAMENGWEARVEARTRDGAVVGAAEAQCLKTERNWGNRDDFALRSMAQTRATAKALRMPLGFVMTLSGIEPTPAEEMTFEKPPAKDNATAKAPPNTATGAARAASAPANHGAESRPAPSPVNGPATEEQRIRWVKQLKAIEDQATAYGYSNGILLPPGDNFPGEPVECWPIGHTPSTKWSAEKLFAKIQAWKPAGAAQPPTQSEFDHGELENAPEAAQDSPEGDLCDPETPQDDVETVTGKLEAVSVKEGRSKKGPWTRYGLRIGQDFWVNTFSNTLGKLAQQDKGNHVRVCYKAGERGNDLVSIERAHK